MQLITAKLQKNDAELLVSAILTIQAGQPLRGGRYHDDTWFSDEQVAALDRINSVLIAAIPPAGGFPEDEL